MLLAGLRSARPQLFFRQGFPHSDQLAAGHAHAAGHRHLELLAELQPLHHAERGELHQLEKPPRFASIQLAPILSAGLGLSLCLRVSWLLFARWGTAEAAVATLVRRIQLLSRRTNLPQIRAIFWDVGGVLLSNAW